MEDIYKTKFEKKWLKIADVLGNFVVAPSMDFAFTFKSDKEWLDIFAKIKLKVISKQYIRNKTRLTTHALYVLEI